MSSRANTLRTLLTIVLTLSYVFVSLRLYIQARITSSFGADDCFLIASLAAFTIYAATAMFGIQNGIGYLNASSSTALRFWLLSEIAINVTTTLLRTGILLQLRKRATLPRQQQLIFGLLASMVFYNLSFLLLSLFQVAPVEMPWVGWGDQRNWMSGVDPGLMSQFGYGYAGVGTGVDWILVLVSPWFCGEGEVGGRLVLAVRWLMLGGLCAGAAGLVRIPTTTKLLTTDNFLFDCVPIAIGSTIEAGLGIMILSATTYRHIFPDFFSSPPKDPPAPPETPGEKQDDSSDTASTSSRSSSTLVATSVTGSDALSQKAGGTSRKVSEEKGKGKGDKEKEKEKDTKVSVKEVGDAKKEKA